MKILAIIIFIAISHFKLHSCQYSNESEEEDSKYLTSMIALTDENFIEAINTNNFLVLFYWSSTSIPGNIVKTVNILAEIFNDGNNSNLKIAYLDCEENNQTCSNNGVNTMPDTKFYLKLFKINDVEGISYTGSSTHLHYVLEFIKEHLNLSASENSGSSKSVVELTDQNFKELTSNGAWFVDFYFSWCIHANNLNPIWDKLASVLDQNASVRIGKIDCDKYQTEICDEYSIRSSPTILWLENGENIDEFNGDRSVKLLKSFVDNKLNGLNNEN